MASTLSVREPSASTGASIGPLHEPRLTQAPAVEQHRGVVYTKPWVVEAMLDLAGYRTALDLAAMRAVEPASGRGAFLLPMARRLLSSCRRQGRRLEEARDALLAYELDVVSAAWSARSLSQLLLDEGATPSQARMLCAAWLRQGDYLLDAPSLPLADFVIGNPPYIRLEEIDPAVASLYRSRYATMIGRADLYVAFFEAALRQLRPDGVCAFLCADRWMLNAYGAELRRLVTSSFAVETVVEMHHADAFDLEVSAYPAITVIRRAPQGSVIVASAGSNPSSAPAHGAELAGALRALRQASHTAAPCTAGTTTVPLEALQVAQVASRQAASTATQAGRGAERGGGVRAARVGSWFSGADPWPCASPERLALLQRLEAEFPTLECGETGTRVGIGVATGCDEVFLTRDTGLVEPSRLLPLAMSGDIRDGRLEWDGQYLVNPWDAAGLIDLADFPRLATYYEAHQERLKNRNVGRRSPERWHRTIDRVRMGLLDQPKLYIPDIKGRIAPALDQGHTYPHHNLYCVQSDEWDMEVLGGLLLSGIAQFFVECYAVRMRGGYLRFQAQYLRRIRVPHREAVAPAQAQALRDAFRRYDAEAATSVALDLYGFSQTERAALAQGANYTAPSSVLSRRKRKVAR